MAYEDRFQQLIGESGGLTSALEQLSRAASTRRPVLLIGERGTGKEMFAERLHFLSPRWQQAHHKINCAAFSDSLLDSELFGHEAGAFTGANKLRLGHFERADQGTLFLDEVATLPLRTQEKLLRVIEYGEFERLGGQNSLQVDVRIVAATHADLPTLAKSGQFRYDLLDRLAFDVVHIPPLRHRREDLPALADFFATQMCVELGRPFHTGFSEATMAKLMAPTWPGNIRELKNVIERAVCHWDAIDEPIDQCILDPFQSPYASPNENAQTKENTQTKETLSDNTGDTSLPEQVKALELTRIREALDRHRGHQQRSAESLGLSYHQMRALLRKYKSELRGDL